MRIDVMFVKHGSIFLLGIALRFAYAVPQPQIIGQQLLGNSYGVPTINRTFDYVIVGGGTAGLAIAARLSEDLATTVAVVEAGSYYELTNGNLSQVPGYVIAFAGKDADDVNPLVDWGFLTTPQKVCNGLILRSELDRTLNDRRELTMQPCTILGAKPLAGQALVTFSRTYL